MTNKEKANELACEDRCSVATRYCSNIRESVLKMAKWKDENFDAFLDYLIVLGNKDVVEAICDYRGEKLEETTITQKDKELLLKDLSARLPYNTK